MEGCDSTKVIIKVRILTRVPEEEDEGSNPFIQIYVTNYLSVSNNKWRKRSVYGHYKKFEYSLTEEQPRFL